MRAVTYGRFGTPDVLTVREVELPTPGPGGVVVQVRAAAVNPLDWHFLRGRPLVIRPLAGLLRPKRRVLGGDVAGEVEAVGTDVTELQPGDAVFGHSGRLGALAEYMCLPAECLVAKPVDLSYEEAAAAALAGLTALQALRDKGRLRAGQAVMVIGAAGGVGTMAVQIAKAFDAEVTGVCRTTKVDLVRSLGADQVIDYTQDDPTRDAGRYDVILDAVGTLSLRGLRGLLRPEGTYVAVAGSPARLAWMALTGRQRLVSMLAHESQADLQALREMLERGTVRPVIGRRYPLDEVADALRYVGEGHAQGKVVITL